jgi:predicted dithiol-disulfide oxidoreductase (DUF899 family)
VIYNFKFPRTYGGDRPFSGRTALLPLEEGPWPSCVALLDQLDGAAEHATQWINLAVVAKTSLPRLLTWADERGWRNLRLLSSAGNSYNRDYFGETADGSQMSMLNVFHRGAESCTRWRTRRLPRRCGSATWRRRSTSSAPRS